MKTKPKLEPALDWWIVEKANRNALHGIFMSRESAERNLREVKPDECARGLFVDKTLTPDSFEVIPAPSRK